jgi:hypothetical protein
MALVSIVATFQDLRDDPGIVDWPISPPRVGRIRDLGRVGNEVSRQFAAA